jgi:hypothetical protein
MKKEIEMAKDIVVIQENEYNEILRQAVAVIENSHFQHNCINSILQKYLRTNVLGTVLLPPLIKIPQLFANLNKNHYICTMTIAKPIINIE